MSARESFEEREDAEREDFQDVINARVRSVLYAADGSIRPKDQRRDVIEYSENADPEIFGDGVLRKAVYAAWKQLRREEKA